MYRFKNNRQNMDKSIDEMLKSKSELTDDDSIYYNDGDEKRDVEIESPKSVIDKNGELKAGERKRFYLFWIIILFVLPPPFGIIVLKFNKVKLKWYHYLLILNIFGFVGMAIFMIFVGLPLQARLHTLSSLAQKIVVKYNLAEYYDMDEPDMSFNYEGGSQSTNPDYEGGLAIDYDKLEELYPGDDEAKVRAQRYQLYSEIEETFGTPMLWLYNVEGQESSSNDILSVSDLYKNYSESVVGGMSSEIASGFSHALGPFQISSPGKHLSIMFESKYSTRASNSETSVYAFHRLTSEGYRSSSADGIAYFDRYKGKDGTPEYDFTATYDPTVDDLVSIMTSMSNNISKNAKSNDFDARVLTAEGSKNYVAIRGNGAYSPESFVNPDKRRSFIGTKVYTGYDEAKTPILLRFNPYYYPDAAASTAYDIKWVTTTLTNSVNGDNGNQKLIVSQSMLDDKMQNSGSTYKEFYLNMTDAQQQEVGALFCLAWFNGVPNDTHADELFKTAVETIALHDTMTAWDITYKYNNSDYVLFSKNEEGKFSSIYGRMNDMWYVIPATYNFLTTDSNGYDYAFQALGQGYVPMTEDKAIFDSVKSTYQNGNTSTTGFKEIKAIQWSEADKLFPRSDSGGPGIMKIIDVETGKRFTAQRTSGTLHADAEPLTASDTATFKEIAGTWGWQRRAILIEGSNGILYAASMNCQPHAPELSEIKDENNFDGVFCIHFRGSKVHVDGDNGVTEAKEDADHQSAIDQALKATQYIDNDAYGNGNSASMGPVYDFTTYYPPILNKKAYTIQPYIPGEHGGVDIVIGGNDTLDKVAFIYGTNQYVEATTPKIKIHAVIDGKVELLRCHAYGKTSSVVDSSTEWSDHKKGTINRSIQGASYPEYSTYGVAEGDSLAIRGTDGKLYWYMHMFCGSQQVEIGDTVKAGQVIGYMGNTGQTYGTTGIHLHFQIGNAGSTENGGWIAKLGYNYDDN